MAGANAAYGSVTLEKGVYSFYQSYCPWLKRLVPRPDRVSAIAPAILCNTDPVLLEGSYPGTNV